MHCTVSHFSLIHVACHQAARRADAALRHPKREWEGATLRNGETLCNNLVPVRGGSVSDAAYASAVATYWENLQVGPSLSALVTCLFLEAAGVTETILICIHVCGVGHTWPPGAEYK